MQAGESRALGDEALSPLEFSINPERVAPLLRRLVDADPHAGAHLRPRGRAAARFAAPLLARRHPALRPAAASREEERELRRARLEQAPRACSDASDRPSLEEIGPANGKRLPEVQQALGGARASVVRVNARGETIVSVAVPIQRFRAVRGALLLSTQGGDIDAIIASERFALLQVFLVAALVMIVLSMLLAGAIAGPVRRLAEAAERVRRGVKAREEIPDFTDRSDEIGHLSGALRDMTRALYNRIDAIESFAADVAHELKNPLTSLRSAVETLPLARSDESRGRLLAIIQHDVRRLDRLISDISDASRLDAELARADAEPVDMARLLDDRGLGRQRAPARATTRASRSTSSRTRAAEDAFFVLGHDSRLGQVFNNLIDNARSFSPADGDGARLAAARRRRRSRSSSTTTGRASRRTRSSASSSASTPTGPTRASARIPGSACRSRARSSRRTGATIRAENRLGPPGPDGEPRRLGARFIVRLPPLG